MVWGLMRRLFSLEISRKTDILALAAFLISLSGIIYQLYVFYRGVDVMFFLPKKVILLAYNIPNSAGSEIIMLNARMAYVNKGSIGYNAVIEREYVRFKIGDEEYEHEWMNYETYILKDSKVVRNYQNDAHPIAINAGSAESHQTSFTPIPVRGASGNAKWKNFLIWEEFLEDIEDIKKMEFEFVADIYGERTQDAGCWIEIDDHFRNALKENKWGAAECVPKQKRS